MMTLEVMIIKAGKFRRKIGKRPLFSYFSPIFHPAMHHVVRERAKDKTASENKNLDS